MAVVSRWVFSKWFLAHHWDIKLNNDIRWAAFKISSLEASISSGLSIHYYRYINIFDILCIFLDISIEDESKDVKLEGDEIETEDLCSTDLSLNQTIQNLDSEVSYYLK